jgi:hypothetical protein
MLMLREKKKIYVSRRSGGQANGYEYSCLFGNKLDQFNMFSDINSLYFSENGCIHTYIKMWTKCAW